MCMSSSDKEQEDFPKSSVCSFMNIALPKICGQPNLGLVWLLNFKFQNNGHYCCDFRLFTRFWSLSTGICSHSATRACLIARPDHPALHQHPTLMLGDKVWFIVGVPVHSKCVGWGWGQGSAQASQFFYTKLQKPFIYGLGFVHEDIVMLKQERNRHKLSQSWKNTIV